MPDRLYVNLQIMVANKEKRLLQEAEGGDATAEPFERRRYTRHELPELLIAIEGHVYQAVNWSLGGVLLSGYVGSRTEGDPISGEFAFVDDPEKLPFDGLVFWQDRAEKKLAIGFTRLGGRAVKLLNAAVSGRQARDCPESLQDRYC